MAIQQTKQTKEEEQINASHTISYQLPKKNLKKPVVSSPRSRTSEVIKTLVVVLIVIAVLVAGYFWLNR